MPKALGVLLGHLMPKGGEDDGEDGGDDPGREAMKEFIKAVHAKDVDAACTAFEGLQEHYDKD
jgi:hypothetical protein